MLLHPVSKDNAIAVTGIGVVLPNASSVDTFWSHVRDGKSQIGYLDRFDTSDFSIKFAAQVRDFDHRRFLPELPEKYAAKYSREILVVMSALEQARHDAGLRREDVAPGRLGLISCSSRSTMEWWYDSIRAESRGEHAFEAHHMLPGLPCTASAMAAIYGGIRGLIMNLSSGCVGGYQAVNAAINELEQDRADAMFVCGYEFPLFRPMLQIYAANKLLCTATEHPTEAMKPYDARRTGFAFGEGSVVLTLERMDRARARGARIYAQIFGVGSMSEANHPTSMDLTGEVTAAFLQEMMRALGRPLQDVDYFCGHGTATRYNDMAEGRAIRALYGSTPRTQWAPMSSIKPIYGHTMGASGVVNLAASALMVHRQTLCPNINCESPDPDCDWDHITEGPRQVPVDLLLSLSFGLGSQTAVVGMGTA
ncbi:beta-ketoacyl-[acyl-carrier-protein] synthase family protein [Pendulispora rubella]|uniref:Beta-ketoacyl-[acyl-carrier-protein] synthase family protein n=1 Tax=Pendulispora rubella TaxID=2741070 RepID=A0ABZ2KTL3_9BACT